MANDINPVVTTGSSEEMNIGELAQAVGTKTETIRYYERIGLLSPPPRTAGNYRDYSEPDSKLRHRLVVPGDSAHQQEAHGQHEPSLR
jgi:hypothetical protein